jgi:DNA repair protein RecN (Recombination protein N)
VLTELRVRDLGVIEDLSLTFGAGMTVLTGETGAGKTLVVEALQLVLGGRAHPAIVRAGATEALVEARFVIEAPEAPEGEREIIIARAVPAEGRSRAWVDGRMSPVSALAETASSLVEIHGQHAHQSLVTPAEQRAVLDAYAGTNTEAVLALRARLREIAASMAALGGDVQARAREADVLRYQVAEIAGAQLSEPGEDDLLRQEETRLADAAAHREAAAHAVELLESTSVPGPGRSNGRRRGGGHAEIDGDGGGDGGILALLAEAAGSLAGREAFDDYRERIAASAIDLSDVARGLRDVVEGWEDDPERLVAVQERRRLLADLRRKYGTDLAAVMAFAEEAATRLDELENAEARAAALEVTRAEVSKELATAEAKVRAVRARAAKKFGALVGERLADLAMAGARVEVRVAPEGTGEPVEIALGANIGEAVLPLAKAASGGELARAMLAVRLVGMGGPQTMVFDEVDAGVGGAAALSLGSALHEVSRTRQVLVVTHLAQVAAKADRQIAVHKDEVDGRTLTSARPVEGEERVVELSRMLSGHPDSDAARAHARELLEV